MGVAPVWSSALNWFGRLPGDIRIERDTARVYVPIVSMLLLSLALTLVFNLARRFFKIERGSRAFSSDSHLSS